jgi:hypothetical protein
LTPQQPSSGPIDLLSGDDEDVIEELRALKEPVLGEEPRQTREEYLRELEALDEMPWYWSVRLVPTTPELTQAQQNALDKLELLEGEALHKLRNPPVEDLWRYNPANPRFRARTYYVEVLQKFKCPHKDCS